MKAILGQSAWLLSAQVLTKIIGFFYTIFLARNLGVEDFGLISVSLTYFALISAFSDFGFNRFLIREVARDHLKASELICSVSLLRLSFTSAIFALFSLVLYIIDPDKARTQLSLLAVMAVLPLGFSQTLDGVFIALQKLQYSSFGLLILSLSTALVGFVLVNLEFGPIGVVVALTSGQLIYAFVLFLILKRQKISFLSAVNEELIIKIAKGALPYGILGILGLIYFRIDTIILGYMRGNFETGLYTAGYKFLEAVIFIPSVVAAAIFPEFARLHDTDKHKLKFLYKKSLIYLGVISILITAVYLLILPNLISILLPNYLGAIDVINILSLSIPFIFLATPGVQILLSTDKYLKTVISFSLITVAFNIILNLLLIPLFGLLAAAWITVASDVLSFIIFYTFIKIRVLK